MNVEMLSNLLELPETHQQILAGYQGAYSLGIGADPDEIGHDPVLILQVEHWSSRKFPSHVRLDGESIRLVVRDDFTAPTALTRIPA
jgi:hypothetical protein